MHNCLMLKNTYDFAQYRNKSTVRIKRKMKKSLKIITLYIEDHLLKFIEIFAEGE